MFISLNLLKFIISILFNNASIILSIYPFTLFYDFIPCIINHLSALFTIPYFFIVFENFINIYWLFMLNSF